MAWINHPWMWLVYSRAFDLTQPSVYRTTLMGPIWEDIQ